MLSSRIHADPMHMHTRYMYLMRYTCTVPTAMRIDSMRIASARQQCGRYNCGAAVCSKYQHTRELTPSSSTHIAAVDPYTAYIRGSGEYFYDYILNIEGTDVYLVFVSTNMSSAEQLQLYADEYVETAINCSIALFMHYFGRLLETNLL